MKRAWRWVTFFSLFAVTAWMSYDGVVPIECHREYYVAGARKCAPAH